MSVICVASRLVDVLFADLRLWADARPGGLAANLAAALRPTGGGEPTVGATACGAPALP